MADDITQTDLDKQRDRIARLREQIAAEQVKAVDGHEGLHNEVEMAQLQAEEARLKAELSATKDASKAAELRRGAAVPLSQAQQQMEEAVAREEAAKAAAAEQEKKAAAEKATQAGEDK